MSRNLKVLGLALLAALALGAIGAQGAAAVVEHSFRSTTNSTVLTGHGESNFIFQPGGTTGPAFACSIATVSGTNVGSTRDTITLHPKYDSCIVSEKKGTFETDGCNFIIDSDTTTSSHWRGSEHGAVSIECEKDGAGNPIHQSKFSVLGCTFIIGSTHPAGTTVNQGLHGARFTQVTHSLKHSVTVSMTLETVHYTALGAPCIGLGLLPGGTYSDGILSGKFTVTGYENGAAAGTTTSGTTWQHGAQVDVTVSTPT